MTTTRFLLRWLPTFLAFPLAGLLVSVALGPVDSPALGALAGAIAGAVVGTAQWLALRGRGVSARWIAATAIGMSVGTAAAAALTGSATSVGALAATGLLTGALVGAAQGLVIRAVRVWAPAVAVAWSLGWVVTAQVIVDADSGYVVFGSSGAILATIATGLVAHRLLPGRAPAAPVLAVS